MRKQHGLESPAQTLLKLSTPDKRRIPPRSTSVPRKRIKKTFRQAIPSPSHVVLSHAPPSHQPRSGAMLRRRGTAHGPALQTPRVVETPPSPFVLAREALLLRHHQPSRLHAPPPTHKLIARPATAKRPRAALARRGRGAAPPRRALGARLPRFNLNLILRLRSISYWD